MTVMMALRLRVTWLAWKRVWPGWPPWWVDKIPWNAC